MGTEKKTEIAVMDMTRSVGDTVMMPKLSADTATIIARPVAIGRGRLLRLSGLTADTGVSGIASMTGTADGIVEMIETVRMIMTAETTTPVLVEKATETATETASGTAVATVKAETLIPVAIGTGMTDETVRHVAHPLDDALLPHVQPTTATSALPATSLTAVTTNDAITTTAAKMAGTAVHPLPDPQRISPIPRRWRKSDAASWQKCNRTPTTWKKIGASALLTSPQKKRRRRKPMTVNARTVDSSCPRCTSVRARIVSTSASAAAVVDYLGWMRIKALQLQDGDQSGIYFLC